MRRDSLMLVYSRTNLSVGAHRYSGSASVLQKNKFANLL